MVVGNCTAIVLLLAWFGLPLALVVGFGIGWFKHADSVPGRKPGEPLR